MCYFFQSWHNCAHVLLFQVQCSLKAEEFIDKRLCSTSCALLCSTMRNCTVYIQHHSAPQSLRQRTRNGRQQDHRTPAPTTPVKV
ncbi:hypothetical protein CHARACLAT_002397 [Characodon lateralis]|uniref:Secreted protein n=1 Tax=Characodon lateralis TaxID=208331 RepID=A0ABU7CKA9_9TELE|nr:hypothetical protein [Characodon lateralis]